MNEKAIPFIRKNIPPADSEQSAGGIVFLLQRIHRELIDPLVTSHRDE